MSLRRGCRVDHEQTSSGLYRAIRGSVNYPLKMPRIMAVEMSCTTQLLLFSEILSKRIEDGLDTDVIYLDFQKAFVKCHTDAYC